MGRSERCLLLVLRRISYIRHPINPFELFISLLLFHFEPRYPLLMLVLHLHCHEFFPLLGIFSLYGNCFVDLRFEIALSLALPKLWLGILQSRIWAITLRGKPFE